MSSDAGINHPFLEPDQFTLKVQCHWCGHTGASLWEDVKGERHLVSLDGFYERLTRKQPYRTETVCNSCGKAQPI